MDQYLDSYPIWSLISYICGHRGGQLFFFLCVLNPQVFHIDNKIGLGQDPDPNTFLSFIGTRGPGPKGQGWNMTYVVDFVIVARIMV